MLSPIGLLNSLTGSGVVLFGCFFGALVIYQSYKKETRLLFYLGFLIISVSLLYLGQLVDFLTILITGTNLDPPVIYALLCYTWIAPSVIIGFYIGAELILPKWKTIITIIYMLLGVIFELFLWFDTENSFTFNLPETPGESIIDVNFNIGHPTFILIAIFIVSVIFFFGFGFLYNGLKSSGIIKRKFLLLSAGWFVFAITGVFDSLSAPGNFLFLIRIGMILSSWFWYFGIKETHIKIKDVKFKEKGFNNEEQIKLIEVLKTSKPTRITEEEVSISKEKKTCLVCKSKLGGFNFICTECGALYCEKCVRALIELENACWVCQEPFDESKPIKLSDEKVYLDELHKNTKK